jgi:regulatory protein
MLIFNLESLRFNMAFGKRNIKKGIKSSDPAVILEKIRYFCSYRERSEAETELKLRSMQVPSVKIREILKELREDGFISDERFARAFARGKWRVRQWGRIRIAYELKQRKIPEKLIKEAMEEIGEEEYREVLADVIRRKAATLHLPVKEENNSRKTLNLRDKIFNFALGKGYESDLVREILDELNF